MTWFYNVMKTEISYSVEGTQATAPEHQWTDRRFNDPPSFWFSSKNISIYRYGFSQNELQGEVRLEIEVSKCCTIYNILKISSSTGS